MAKLNKEKWMATNPYEFEKDGEGNLWILIDEGGQIIKQQLPNNSPTKFLLKQLKKDRFQDIKMKNNTLIILKNEIKKLKVRLEDIEDIEKSNEKMSNLQFEQRKEGSRKSIKIQIELKQAYLDGYNKAINDALREKSGGDGKQ